MALVFATTPQIVAMTKHSTGDMPVDWQLAFADAQAEYHQAHPGAHLTKEAMMSMPDEWQARMAKLLDTYTLYNR
jgi:hypothetical protein